MWTAHQHVQPSIIHMHPAREHRTLAKGASGHKSRSSWTAGAVGSPAAPTPWGLALGARPSPRPPCAHVCACSTAVTRCMSDDVPAVDPGPCS